MSSHDEHAAPASAAAAPASDDHGHSKGDFFQRLWRRSRWPLAITAAIVVVIGVVAVLGSREPVKVATTPPPAPAATPDRQLVEAIQTLTKRLDSLESKTPAAPAAAPATPSPVQPVVGGWDSPQARKAEIAAVCAATLDPRDVLLMLASDFRTYSSILQNDCEVASKLTPLPSLPPPVQAAAPVPPPPPVQVAQYYQPGSTYAAPVSPPPPELPDEGGYNGGGYGTSYPVVNPTGLGLRPYGNSSARSGMSGPKCPAGSNFDPRYGKCIGGTLHDITLDEGRRAYLANCVGEIKVQYVQRGDKIVQQQRCQR